MVLLTTAGVHTPVMPLGDVVGKIGAGIPLHNIILIGKSGTVAGLTVMVTEFERLQTAADPSKERSSIAKSFPVASVFRS